MDVRKVYGCYRMVVFCSVKTRGQPFAEKRRGYEKSYPSSKPNWRKKRPGSMLN